MKVSPHVYLGEVGAAFRIYDAVAYKCNRYQKFCKDVAPPLHGVTY